MWEVDEVRKGLGLGTAGEYGRCSSVRATAIKHNRDQPTRRPLDTRRGVETLTTNPRHFREGPPGTQTRWWSGT